MQTSLCVHREKCGIFDERERGRYGGAVRFCKERQCTDIFDSDEFKS